MERSIALFDIDKTSYRDFLLFSIVEKQANDGLIDQSCVLDLNSMLGLYQNGQMDYESMVDAVIRRWALALESVVVSSVVEHTERYLAERLHNFNFFVPDVIGEIKGTHAIFFVTGEPQFVAKATPDLFGGDGFICSEFEVSDGKFTGKVSTMLSSRAHKREAIGHLLENYQFEDSLAFGDSEADYEMLSAVQIPVCVNPNQGLRSLAEANSWFIADDPSQIADFVREKLAK